MESLLEHSKEISTYIEKYNEIYSLVEENESGEDLENEEEDPEAERED